MSEEDNLREEVKRLEQCIKAQSESKGNVVRIELLDDKMPPTLLVTAPAMNGRELAFCLAEEFYTPYFKGWETEAREQRKASKIRRKTFHDAAALAERFGHTACARELRRRADDDG